jgi:hypothetical protein
MIMHFAVLGKAEAPKAVDVCALFAEPERWNGVLISVSANLVNGHGEGGPWLSGEHCSTHIIVKREKFPNLLELVDPKSRDALHKVDYKWDEDSWNQYYDLVNRVNRKSEHVRLTVIGVFETRSPLTDLVRDGRDNGFGHLGGSPGQILVKTMTDLRIEKNEK